MITQEDEERVRGWFTGRIPEEWQAAPVAVVVDREEITVSLTLPDVELSETAGAAEAAETRAGRTKAFREDTRGKRMSIAAEAERRFDRKVSWQGTVGDRTELFTHAAAPGLTRRRQPQRQGAATPLAA